MFSRWLFVDLKTAEKALQNGRIEEAFERLSRPDARNHSRAPRLLDDLARMLLARVRLHVQAGRRREAIEDLDRLAVIGREGADAALIRRGLLEELRQQGQRQADLNDARVQAEQNLRAGRLESGRLAIDRVQDAAARQDLRDELDVRVQRSEQLIEQARAALAAGELLSACRFWDEACHKHGRTRASDLFAADLASALRRNLDNWFREGRLDRFCAALAAAHSLATLDPTLEEYQRLGGAVEQAAAQLASQQHHALRATLLRLLAAQSEARWLKETLSALEAVFEGQERLFSSPLGLLDQANAQPEDTGKPLPDHRQRFPDDARRDSRAADPHAATLAGAALLLLVDGSGSSLVLNRDVVRIGRASGGSGPIDVPIPADVHSHHADVVRSGEDYFLIAYGPVEVNHKRVERILLRNGDRIVLAPKAKLVFSRPSDKSESAVLRMGSGCRLPQDVSQVVLFRDTCLLGPQASAHIQIREGKSRLVLFERAGRLMARYSTADTLLGNADARTEPVILHKTLSFGDVTLTVKPYEQRERGCAL